MFTKLFNAGCAVASNDSPCTGDNFNVWLPIVLAGVAIVAIALIVVAKKRNKKK